MTQPTVSSTEGQQLVSPPGQGPIQKKVVIMNVKVKMRQADSIPSWKNMAAEYDFEGKILQSVYLTVFAMTGMQHFS